MTVSHWDEVEREVRDVGDMRATFRELADGLSVIDVEPGYRAGPVHVHESEEEIFYVRGGSGLAWLDGAVHEISVGDTIVYLAGGPQHTVIAGPSGLSVLAYGENHDPALVRLPRAGMIRRGAIWLEASADDPVEREAAAGPLVVPEPTPRPSCIVALEDVELEVEKIGEFDLRERDMARAAGSIRTGLRHDVLAPGTLSCPPHWHSDEREIFIVLDGDGELELYDNAGQIAERHPLRPGSCVARTGRRRLAHALRAGDTELTYLAYGPREPGDYVYYPRSRKALLGGVMIRVDVVDDYWEGEV